MGKNAREKEVISLTDQCRALTHIQPGCPPAPPSCSHFLGWLSIVPSAQSCLENAESCVHYGSDCKGLCWGLKVREPHQGLLFGRGQSRKEVGTGHTPGPQLTPARVNSRIFLFHMLSFHVSFHLDKGLWVKYIWKPLTFGCDLDCWPSGAEKGHQT